MSQSSSDQPASGFSSEFQSLQTPEAKDVAKPVEAGSGAPSSSQLPLPDGRPTVVVFLRHCGNPFAERTFKSLAALSYDHRDVHCVAISHSSADATDRWVTQVGGTWNVDVIVDDKRDLYAKWGLGLGSVWQTLGPGVLYSVFRLGMNEGIWNRPTESGTRWQKSGAFAVDADGIVQWAHVDTTASDVPDLTAAVKSLGVSPAA